MSSLHFDVTDRSVPYKRMTTIKVVATAGQALVVDDLCENYLIAPAGTLATLSVKFPKAPLHGQILRISTTQDITLLTQVANTGQTIAGSPAAAILSANTSLHYIHNSPDLTWYVG